MLAKTAHQFYYTSCKRGLSGYAGFQTRAESVGLALEDRRELERKSGYQPPRDTERATGATSDVGGDFMIEACPRSHKVLQLGSGRTAVVQSAYSGEDYSGRTGNYFAHALVFDGRPGKLWPVDLFAWPDWVHALKPAEADQKPDPLPQISLETCAIGDDFGFPELNAFLNEGTGRRDDLARMIHAVLAGVASRRKVVIREVSTIAAMYWIACVSKAFPRNCQGGVTCSTFQFDPRGALAINATVGQTDFLFDEAEREYQFYVFDFVSQRHSALDVEVHEYAATVASWMALDPARVLRFHDFAEHFALSEPDARLHHLVRLFRIQEGEALDLSATDLDEMLDFIGGFGTPVAVQIVLGKATALLAVLAHAPPEHWVRSFRRLIQFASAQPDSAIVPHFSAIWVDGFQRIVVHEGGEARALFALRDELVAQMPATRELIRKATIRSAQITCLCDAVPRLDAHALEATMAQLLWASVRGGAWHDLDRWPVHRLIETAMRGMETASDTFAWALRPVHDHPQGLFALLELIVEIIDDQDACQPAGTSTRLALLTQVGADLADLFRGTLSPVHVDTMRLMRDDPRFSRVLFTAWQCGIDAANQTLAWQVAYESAVFEKSSIYQEHELPNILAHLRVLLAPPQFREHLLGWARPHRMSALSNEAAERVFVLMLDAIDFTIDDDHSVQLAVFIEAEVRRRKMRTPTVAATLRLNTRRAVAGDRLSASAVEAIRDADECTYRAFLRPVLSYRLQQATDATRYGEVLVDLLNFGREDDFRKVLYEDLRAVPFKKLQRLERIELTFWIQLNKMHPHWPALKGLQDDALRATVAALGHAKPRLLAKAIAFVEGLPATNSAHIKAAFLLELTRLLRSQQHWRRWFFL